MFAFTFTLFAFYHLPHHDSWISKETWMFSTSHTNTTHSDTCVGRALSPYFSKIIHGILNTLIHLAFYPATHQTRSQTYEGSYYEHPCLAKMKSNIKKKRKLKPRISW